MPRYRLYRMVGVKVVGPSTVIVCKDDNDAIDETRQIVDRYDIVIWRDARVVKRINVRN